MNEKQELLPSSVTGTAKAYDGTARNLTNLNDFLRAYGNFDVQKGSFSLYAEAATRNNKIVGYVKPIIKDIDVAAWKKEEGNVLQAAWETIVEFAAWFFKNQPKDQLATQVKFEGNIKNPDVDIWSIIGETLKNAFIKALIPSLKNSISMREGGTFKSGESGAIEINEKKDEEKKEGFLKRLFNKDDKKKDDEKKEKDKN